ncbi:hypothetical protein [Chryseobacterium sp. RLHN22]|uniref:hypothetical protein n=1 Tax=Chryseobacterium sp. RLHN22 TaxID=3437885 RepID=UPI003D9B7FB6
MEQIIITGLLFIIILILWDKKFISNKKSSTEKDLKLPSIMGETKIEERNLKPSAADQGQEESIVSNTNIFESETKGEEFENIPLKNDLDEILINNNDLEEEEDWYNQNNSEIESGFATGVTFQELSTAGQLLQEEILEPDLEQQAVDIIQKIQGTELFNLLENSLGDASKRIAHLLSQSTSNDESQISFRGKNDAEGFDIGEFV